MRLFWLALGGLLCGTVLSTGLWMTWVAAAFELKPPMGANLKAAAMLAFSASNLLPITIGSLAVGYGLSLVGVWLAWLLGNPHMKPSRHVRGATFASVPVLKRMTNEQTVRNRFLRVKAAFQFAHEKPGPAQIWRDFWRHVPQATVGGVPIPVAVEPLHMLVAGTTGAGKSQAIKEILAGAVKRGDRVLVVDPNGDYYSIFARPGDLVLNPFDRRTPGWSIFNEIRSTYDCERFARSVVPDGTGDMREWNGYAQFLLKEVMNKLWSQGCRETSVLIKFVCELPIPTLGEYMADTAAASMFSEGAEKTMGSTRFIATKHLGPHKHMPQGDFSLRDWLEQASGNLYITWREDMADALRSLISTWFDVVITATLSAPVHGPPRPTWFVCDELASLEKLSSLEAGLTKGRKHGARFLCGIQSTAQLDDLYGKEKAVTLRSCFRNLLFLNIPHTDPATAEELSKGVGEMEFVRKETQRSVGWSLKNSSRTISRRNVTEKALLPSQIQDLPNLKAYVSFAGDYPITKLSLASHLFPKIGVPFEARLEAPPADPVMSSTYASGTS
ncbi:type IV secretion system DNA-binding domain-containing protein [Hydrogenophaga sp.]|uniref:type IV secretion system DNA-binding domain-containing protein n=1 Tax=Hydrogenophaga sp. TaxID=1904254 RepID=UPI00260F0BA7|nr:type IV secretion system DNA-binding domain-containing protein [Hydrogenophaga sp.]MCW5654243.1 type IV secretion system DNA-binding domain-containing protein [Hydrogenophaga sp.]